VSSNDFDGSEQDPGKGQYPAPEGWGSDGFWRDSAIDSDYETGLTGAVRPDSGAPHDDPGYSYWADGKGWENSPGKPAAGTGDATSYDATSYDATRGNFTPYGGSGGSGATWANIRGQADGAGGYGADDTSRYYGNGDPAGVYGGGPGYGPGDPGYGPGGPGYGPGGPGPGGPGGPNGPGRNGRRKGPWWRPTWKKAGIAAAAFVLLIVLAGFGVYQYISSTTVIPASLASAKYQSTQVYYSDGKTLMGTIGVYNRHTLLYDQIPVVLQNAVLAAEDKNFRTEGGISPTGIVRAAIHDLTSGGGLNGGSTITQEFVRNYYDGIGTQQTMSRKIREVFIAQKLAQTKSKQWILTNYLNLIPLGDHALGVAAAAQTYFGIPASNINTISIAQSAVIAGIIQQPGLYPLKSYRPQLIVRWHYVIDQMVKDGFITQAQADAQTFPKMLTDTTYNPNTGTSFANEDRQPWVPYLMTVVQNEIEAHDGITAAELETGGMRIVTTISRPMEIEMYKAVAENMARLKANGIKIPTWIRIGAELQDPKTGAILATYPGPGQNMPAARCKLLDCDLDTAVYSREQVGSSFKQYVLATAVKEHMNVQTSILNASPFVCVAPDMEVTTLSQTEKSLMCPATKPGWFPVENDGGEIIGDPKKGGSSPVTRALALSSNTAFSDLAHRAGTQNIINMAQQFGVNTADFPNGSGLQHLQGGVGLALGTASLTVNEQTTTIATIANGGVYHTAHVIASYQLGSDRTVHKPVIETHNMFASDAATNASLDSQVQYAMSQTTVYGTGTGAVAGLNYRPVIGKTGTTTGAHSAFFVGALPQYALTVGIFTKTQNALDTTESVEVLGSGGFGGAVPASIWDTFAQAEFNNLPVQNFLPFSPSGTLWNMVGKLPKPKPKCTVTIHGHKIRVPGKGCKNNPNPTPTPTPTPSTNCHPFFKCPTPTPTPTTTSPTGFPTPTTTTPTGTGTPTSTATGTPTSTATTSGPPGPPGQGGATINTVQAGLALGGVLTVLPGSLLWVRTADRRRRKRRDCAQ
jgi:membrane peptidoglycan carboxypeptidase